MLADRVEHYTNVAREIGDILRERGEPQGAEFVQSIAGRGMEAARYLRNNDPAAMWNDAQDLVRGKTWLLAGAGFLGGLALARAVRTAASESEMRGGNWEDRPAYRDSYAQPASMQPVTGTGAGYDS